MSFIADIFGGSQTMAVSPAPPAPTMDSVDVSAAAAAERKRRSLAGGRASTMMMGEAESDAPVTAKAKLLGQ